MHDREQPPPPPRSRWTLILTCGAVLLGGLLAAWFYLDHRHAQVLQRALEETHRLEPDGWQLEDLERRRRAVTDADNSSLLLQEAKPLRPQKWMFWDGYGPEEDDEERTQGALYHLQAMVNLAPNRLLSELQHNALRNELCRGHEFMEAVRKGAAKPWGRYPITYTKDGLSTPLPYLQSARDYAHAMNWDGLLQAHRGDLAAALEDCRGSINCGRAIGDEPTLISGLVRIALDAQALKRIERVLAQGEPPPEALLRMQKFLEEEEAEGILTHGARGERAFIDRLVVALQRGDITYAKVRTMMRSSGRSQLYGLEDWAFWATSGSADLNRAAFLELHNRFVAIAQRPVEEMPAAMQELTAEAERRPKFVRSLFPAANKVTSAYVKMITQSRCVRVMLAAEQYRQQHGRWPEKLEELAPEFLDQVPLDPHDGQPLRWLRRDDGWTVYSVSNDGVDDGGNVLQPSLKRGADLGFRLYDVSQRRLPQGETDPR